MIRKKIGVVTHKGTRKPSVLEFFAAIDSIVEVDYLGSDGVKERSRKRFAKK